LRDTLRQVADSATLQLRVFGGSTHIVLGFVQPAAFTLVVLLSRRDHAGADMSAAALGAGLLSLWGSTIWQAGQILKFEKRQGTLIQIMVRPCSLAAVLLGKSLGTTVRSVLSIAMTVGLMSFLVGHGIRIAEPLLMVATLAVVIASASVLGMLLSCLFIMVRAASRIAEALTYPVFILGGILVPLSLMPRAVRPFAEVVSLHRGGELVQAAATGVPQSGTSWLLFLLNTAAYGLLAVAAFRVVLRRARSAGSLELQ
jgi:ABC-2 type transport system permease protein